MKKKYITLVIIFVVFIECLVSVELKFEKRWSINANKKVLLAGAGQFSIDDMEYLYIPDIKMSNIKIFSNSGKLFSVLGTKGLGPNEFLMPVFSYLFKNEIVFVDLMRRNFFLYKIDKNKKLKNILKGRVDAVTDVSMDRTYIYIAGYMVIKDKEYALYSINKTSGEHRGILLYKKSFSSIGTSSYSKKNSPQYEAIGMMGHLGLYKNHIYYIWEGDLKIRKVNIKEKSISLFGNKTKNYIKPFITSRIKKGMREKNRKIIKKGKEKMSRVGSLKVNSKYVIISYLTPDKLLKRKVRYFQFYNHKGEFLNEIYAPRALRFGDEDEGVEFFLKKDILYVLRRVSNEDGSEFHEVLKYKII